MATAFQATILVALSCLPSLALDTAKNLDQFSYQTWQTENGLPQNTVHDVLQTRDGYIWLATEGGLVRFDGFKFVVFESRNTASLRSNNVRSLAEDRDGSLWIATADGLCRLENGHFQLFTATEGLPETNLLALYKNEFGQIWAVTPDGLVRLGADRSGKPVFTSYPLAEGSPKLTGAVASGRGGATWVGTQAGLKIFRDGRFSNAPGAAMLALSGTGALLLDHSQRLWIGTKKGLFVSEPDKSDTYTPVSGVPARAILTLFEDREGSIWIGSEHGPARFTDETPLRSSRALSGVAVTAFFEDTEGDLWMGTDSEGVTVARNQKFVTYTSKDGLADDAVRCVFQDRKGVVWVGTNAGLTSITHGQFTQLTTQSGLSSNVILSLAEDDEGDLLIGTPDGLNRLRAGTISVITSADGLADDFVRSIYKDADGSLWIGTRRGLSHMEGKRFTTYAQSDGLGSDLVGAMLRDRQGDLWIGTLGGLTRFRRGQFSTYTVRDGLSSNVITTLHEDREGDLWIGTQDGGLSIRRNGKFARFPRTLGLPETIYGIAEGAEGDLWLSSNAGIVRASKAQLEDVAEGKANQATVVWYGTSDGLRISDCGVGGHPEAWRANDGTLWFGTLKGVAALYPSAAKLNRVPPPIVIEAVTIDDQTRPSAQIYEIGPGHSRLAFEYAGLSFVAPQKVQYRYQLEGFDKQWIEAGTRRTAYYTNLAPGRYRFRVLARNNDGFWNENGAALSFRLKPRFYQTYWFYFLIALSLGFAGYLIYRWRVSEVEARFSAVLQERNRIAREIHDTLAQGFVGVSVQLEIVSRLLASSAGSAREHLDQARVLVRDSLAEARRSIWQLRSQSDENGDLASRLSKAANQAVGMRPVKLSVAVHGTYRPLNSGMEDELLRIGQEAVANALRHGNPRCIDIELSFDVKKLRMSIADDGCGFETGTYSSGPNGHFGLRGMRERAEQIEARLTIDSTEGKGTRVLVEAPLG